MAATALRRVTCGELTAADDGSTVEIRGWVNVARDHGGLIFVDLRDRFGITQTVFDPRLAEQATASAASLRSEDVILVRGAVRKRPPGTDNAKLATGQIEIAASELQVLNRAQTPPFPIHADGEIDESLRLRFRYLDLRRPHMQRNIILRHRAIKAVRDYLDEQGFLEIETPMLIKQTPEGARDFIVPSRLHPSQFYALPQSPQLFKQLLMVAGFHRYFQIARCFRDEDTRSDRQPEFTQIDLEMAFPTQDDVIMVIEGTLQHMFRAALDVEIPVPFPRLTHAQAMREYGSDKPDLRFGMQLHEFTDIFRTSEFKIFAAAAQSGKSILGFSERGGATRSRREFDSLVASALELGAKGLAWIALAADGIKSSLPKAALGTEAISQLKEASGAGDGDALYFVADEPLLAQALAGKLRLQIADERGLRDPHKFAFCWVLDFPLFERDAESGALMPAHHPFTAPAPGQESLAGDPLALRAQHYDCVLNGMELGSGSIRIHDPELQQEIFTLLGYRDEDVRSRFGFLLEAFSYGAPPHGGMALGVDRILLAMVGGDSIREVIAFPKNQRFQDLMVNAPDAVPPEMLRELHLKSTFEPPRRA